MPTVTAQQAQNSLPADSGEYTRKSQLMVWRREHYGLPVNVIFLIIMKLSHEISTDMTLDHKGRLPPKVGEFLAKNRAGRSGTV